mgnify:CR=1 FL=1
MVYHLAIWLQYQLRNLSPATRQPNPWCLFVLLGRIRVLILYLEELTSTSGDRRRQLLHPRIIARGTWIPPEVVCTELIAI